MRPKYFFISLIFVAIIALLGAGFLYREYRNYRRTEAAKKIVKAETVKVTFIEGWTINNVAEALEKQNLITKEKFKTELKNFDLSPFPIISASKPKTADFEGYLFPDTYFFTKDSEPKEIISKILENFESRAESAGAKSEKTLYNIPGYENLAGDMTLYQIITLASIVEKESGGKGLTESELNDQRATVAGIFYNRLVKGQALESDATINYITGKDDPSPLFSDLEVKSAYNTYRNPGLPPGPICNPSLASIKAVLNPKKTDNYFFLHVQPSGQVLYSRTFEEHVQKKLQNR